jgi:hypothetical protein
MREIPEAVSNSRFQKNAEWAGAELPLYPARFFQRGNHYAVVKVFDESAR